MLHSVFVKVYDHGLYFTMKYAPGLTRLLLQPVRAYYVFPFGGLSSVYEPRESVAVSNWQS